MDFLDKLNLTEYISTASYLPEEKRMFTGMHKSLGRLLTPGKLEYLCQALVLVTSENTNKNLVSSRNTVLHSSTHQPSIFGLTQQLCIFSFPMCFEGIMSRIATHILIMLRGSWMFL